MIVRRLVFLALLLSSVAAAEEIDACHVTAYGTATISVVPDQMMWRIEVRNHNVTSAKDAATGHEGLVADVMSALSDFSIEESSIQSSDMRLRKVWKSEFGNQIFDGYEAATTVDFVLSDFEKYSEVWLGLSDLPAVSVQRVNIGHSDRIRYQNEARTAAVLAARDKATAMAGALGASIGRPLVVEEESAEKSFLSRAPMVSNTLSFSGKSEVIGDYMAPGYLDVSVRVKGVFELLDGQ